MGNEDYKLYVVCLTASYAGPISEWDCTVGRTEEEAKRNYEPKRKELSKKVGGSRQIFAKFKEVDIPGFKITVTPEQ